MRRVNFNNKRHGIIKFEIQSMMPEKFLNLLWKNNIKISNIVRISVTTMTMEARLKDYLTIEEIAKKTGTRIKIVQRKGMAFFLLRVRKQFTLIGGAAIFALGLYFLSTYIWKIEIEADRYLSPFEIRQKLYSYGIKPGISKSKLNVKDLEERIRKENDDILWVRVRIEGASLKVSVAERLTPPQVIETEGTTCDLVSSMDGEITRIFTTAGTALVKPGDMVKTGEILVKGQQGKEGSTYEVYAKGEVYAKTFYEKTREMPLYGSTVERTGSVSKNFYIKLFGKKIYIKKALNKFASYDKIEDNNGILYKETYFETKKKEYTLDKDSVTKQSIEDMEKSVMESLDKNVKLLDKIVEVNEENGNLSIRVVFIIEQNIAVPLRSQ